MDANVYADDVYLHSLNVPFFRCDREDTEQLQMHFLCSLLCCPKQIETDQTVRAELVNINMRDVSHFDMDLYVVGRIATNDDKEELERIDKNLERVFQLPLFEKFVGLDDNAKFKLYPPSNILPLYERILAGGQYVRQKEGTTELRKQKECNTPQAVYRSKVVCNFLMELIEREKRHQKTKTFVDWQSIQKRYEKMCTDEDSEDRSLMEEYKTKYRLVFPQNNLNSDVIKTWTGRSSITKALSMSVFCKIISKVDLSTGLIRVNFGDSTTLYSDEELKRAFQAMLEDNEQKGKSSSKEHRRRKEQAEPECTPEELASIVPLRQRQPQSVVASIIPDAAFSPFTAPYELDAKKPTSEWIDVHPDEDEHTSINMNEPQYIPTSASVEDLSVSNEYSDSDVDANKSGVFTDDEELEEAGQSTNELEKPVTSSILHQKPGQSSDVRPEPTRISEPKISRDGSRSSFHFKPSIRQEELKRPEETVKSFANPWEVYQEEHLAGEKSMAGQKNSPFASQIDAASAAVFAPSTPLPSSSPIQSRHTSAFASCRSPSVAKKDNDIGKSVGRVVAETEGETTKGGLYERKSSVWNQQEQGGRKSNTSSASNPRFGYQRRDINDRPLLNRQSLDIDEPETANFDSYSPESQNRDKSQPMQQPLKAAPETSVFSRPIAESSVFARPIATSCVRTRTPVHNDTDRTREPLRSYTALGGREYDESAHTRKHDAYHLPFGSHIEGPEAGRRSYGQPDRDRAYFDEERNRPRSSASRFDNARYDNHDALDSSRWRESREEKYRNNTYAYYERDYPSHFHWNDDREGNPVRRCDGSFDERARNYNRGDSNRGFGNDYYQGGGERSTSGCRQRVREHSSQSRSGSSSCAQSHAAMERDFSDSYNEGFINHRGFRERASYESSIPRQEQSRRNSPTPVLTEDQRARLRIIRDFTFLYRDSAHGYQTLGNLFKILPADSSVNWDSLIRSRLPQIELANFRGSPVLIWKKGSNPEDNASNI